MSDRSPARLQELNALASSNREKLPWLLQAGLLPMLHRLIDEPGGSSAEDSGAGISSDLPPPMVSPPACLPDKPCQRHFLHWNRPCAALPPLCSHAMARHG